MKEMTFINKPVKKPKGDPPDITASGKKSFYSNVYVNQITNKTSIVHSYSFNIFPLIWTSQCEGTETSIGLKPIKLKCIEGSN